MKKRRNRVFAVLLAVLLLAGYLPIAPQAGAAIVDAGICGDNLTWTLDSDGALIISGTGGITLELPWRTRAFVENVRINNGVTSIGDWAFSTASFT